MSQIVVNSYVYGRSTSVKEHDDNDDDDDMMINGGY